MTWTRTKDEGVVGEILRPHLPTLQGMNWKDVLADEDNIFLVSDDNLAIFEKDRDRVYLGHYFFNSARGKEAIKLSKEALGYIYDIAEVIQGWTPIENKAACWLSRRLGFTSHGLIETIAGTMELFIMTKNEWRMRNE